MDKPENRAIAPRQLNGVKCRHSRKHKDWIGVVYQQVWGIPEMVDVQWVKAPIDSDGKMTAIPAFPVRYPIKDLIFKESP